jgi:hypothetical protein
MTQSQIRKRIDQLDHGIKVAVSLGDFVAVAVFVKAIKILHQKLREQGGV